MIATIAASAYSRTADMYNSISLSSAAGLARNVSKVAIPAIALLAVANLPTAAADPYVNCMNSCDRVEHELIKLICYACCLFAK